MADNKALARALLDTGGLQRFQSLLRPLQYPEYRKNFDLNSDDSRSTEIEVTMTLPTGEVVNIPSLWMGPVGPVELDPDSALDMALNYEMRTGEKFPRFRSIPEAVNAAKKRSAHGGIAAGPLASPAPNLGLLKDY